MVKFQRMFFITFLIISSSGLIVFTSAQNNSTFDNAKQLLVEARDRIYNFDKNDSMISSDLYQSKNLFNSLSNTKDRMYWLAQVEYYDGLFSLTKQQKKEAEMHFANCNQILTKAIKQVGEFSEAYSLMADSHMQLMMSKGITYQLLNGQKLKILPEKALRLDSANTRAYQPLAVYCMNAPEPLGGSIQKAINLLMKLSSKDKSEMFKIYYLLGNAYMKIHDSVMASQYLQLALSIYPHNRWAKEDLETVTKKK